MEKEESVAVDDTHKFPAETTPQVFRRTVGEHGSAVALRKKEFGLWQDFTWEDYYRQVRLAGAFWAVCKVIPWPAVAFQA